MLACLKHTAILPYNRFIAIVFPYRQARTHADIYIYSAMLRCAGLGWAPQLNRKVSSLSFPDEITIFHAEQKLKYRHGHVHHHHINTEICKGILMNPYV